MPTMTGRCLCRAVQFELRTDSQPVAYYCHCETCRRATSSPATAWLLVPRASLRWTAGTPKVFLSSPGARRGFCADCGAPLFYESERFPDSVDLYAASLDDPSGLVLTRHVHSAEQLPWFEVLDQLPRFATSSRDPAGPIRHGPRSSA